MALGVVPALHRRGQQAEVAGDGAGADLRVAEGDAVAVGQQPLVERRRQRSASPSVLAVSASRPMLTSHSSSNGRLAKSSAARAVEHLARLGRSAQLRRHLREHAAPDRVRRVDLHRVPNQVLDLVEPALLAAEQVELESVRDGGVPALGAPAQAQGARDQVLRLGERSLEQREERRCTRRTNQSCEGCRSSSASLVMAARSAFAAGMSPSSIRAVEAMLVSLRGPFQVAGLHRQLELLRPQRQLRAGELGRVVGRDVAGDAHSPASPGHRGGGAISSASSLDDLLRSGSKTGVAKRAARETGEQHDPQGAVLFPKRGQRPLEQRHVIRRRPARPPR